MGKYQAYPEYKSSDVEFIGNLPITWSLSKLKHMISIINGSTPKSGVSAYWDGDITWVTPADLSKLPTFQIWSSARSITQEGLNSCGTTIVPSGSLVLSSRAPIGSLAVTAVPLCTNQGCKSLIPKNKIYIKYIYYYLIAMKEQLNLFGRGTTFLELSTDDLGNFPIPSLPHSEWENIANFLDHETAKIDALIEKQQQLISLLQEKRQAVISHAVTKGLNLDVPMKDSGVEWLGQVPEHWEIVSVRNLIRGAKLQIQDGNHGELHPVANDYVNDGVPFLMANNVRNGKVDTSSCKRIPKSLADKLRIGFAKAGDMLLTHKGTVGEIGIIPKEMKEDYWMLTPQVTYYRWLHHSLFNGFFYYQFQSVSVATQLDIIAGKQSTRGYVGLIAQGDIELAIPPLNEQLEIASQLQADVKKLEDLIQKAEKLVLLQKERRTALISAAVTGKIDVRNWQASSQSSTTSTEEQAL